jgi:uncharacterized membrane protein YkoI
MKIISLFLVLVAGTISAPTYADSDFSRSEILQLVKEGKILSLEIMLARYPEKEYGKLLDLEVEREHGKIIYEMEFLRDDGRVLEVNIDASNGQLLKQELE